MKNERPKEKTKKETDNKDWTQNDEEIKEFKEWKSPKISLQV